MKRKNFEELVLLALYSLPEEIQTAIRNLDIVVEDYPPQEVLVSHNLSSPLELLGLYQGIPLPLRGQNYSGVLPDKISIYKRPIEILSRTEEETIKLVQNVVIHELGHYFGLSDEEMSLGSSLLDS